MATSARGKPHIGASRKPACALREGGQLHAYPLPQARTTVAMWVKGIVIEGFKNYKERITLDLSNGHNVVVGANGSGKSNFFAGACRAHAEAAACVARRPATPERAAAAAEPERACVCAPRSD